jgi:hypothetical protein
MAAEEKEFLDRIAYGEGEFEQLQEMFDRAVAEYAAELEAPVGSALRRELAGDVASEWTAQVTRAVGDLLERPDAELESEAKVFMVELRDALLSSLPAEIEKEIRSCCRELSQLVLARWFSKLRGARCENTAVRLNRQMLPGTDTVEETLIGINFATYGVERAIVTAALREYRNALETRFYADFRPIEFGARLLIVPDRSESNQNQPFVLAMSRDLAERCAEQERLRSLRHKSRHELGETLTERFAAIVAVVGEALGYPVPQPGLALVSAVRETCLSMRQRLASSTAAHWGWVDEEHVIRPVELGVDVLSSTLAKSREEAIATLSQRRAEITADLASYAKESQIELSAVTHVYTLAVAAGVELRPFVEFPAPSVSVSQTIRGVVFGSGPGPEERIEEALGLPASQTVRLVQDSFGCIALSSGGDVVQRTGFTRRSVSRLLGR